MQHKNVVCPLFTFLISDFVFEIFSRQIYNINMDEIKYLLADFIDEFNRADMAKKQQMVRRFPFKKITDKKYAAYIAAAVEELCYINNMDTPEWVFDKKYRLKEPFFVGGLESLKAFLIAESPVSFRRRNIFVSENVLKRV
jgi:hypothetical protein